jgi:hypothetical protein
VRDGGHIRLGMKGPINFHVVGPRRYSIVAAAGETLRVVGCGASPLQPRTREPCPSAPTIHLVRMLPRKNRIESPSMPHTGVCHRNWTPHSSALNTSRWCNAGLRKPNPRPQGKSAETSWPSCKKETPRKLILRPM